MRRQFWVTVFCLAAVACSDGPATDAAPPTGPVATAPASAVPAPAASAAPESEPSSAAVLAVDVITEDVAYGATDDYNMNGYMVLPADAIDPPAVLVIHEQSGLNNDTRQLARRLAGQGYAVLAVDLYAGNTGRDAEARAASLVANRAAVLDNLQQAHTYLDEFVLAPAIGIVGLGLGGDWALEASLEFGDRIDAVVTYYGRILIDDELLSSLQAPLLGIFAADDASITSRDVQRFRGLLRDLDKRAQVLIYPDVDRGFANPGSDSFSPDVAAEAWNDMLGFLAAELR